MPQFKLISVQQGLEGTPGTLVPATFKHKGNGTLKFADSVRTPELEYALGTLGGNVEGAYVPETGSVLTLSDCPFSAETMIWTGNRAIKALPGAASSFAFAFPTTAANTINYFTMEMATATQEYEFGYGFTRSFNVHGDVGADNGALMYNEVIEGRKAAASTATASLGFLANYHPLSINYTTIHVDAVGTAAGTASAITGWVRGFSIDVETGWSTENARFAAGRSALDFDVPTFGDYKITGNIKALFGSNSVTQLANARAGTPIVFALKCNGASSRLVTFALPSVFTAAPDLGTDDNGLHVVEFEFSSAYSRTATAQGPSITVTATASTTVT